MSLTCCKSDNDGALDSVPVAKHHAIEVKRHATIDSVEQVCRYVEYLNRDSNLQPVQGWLAAQSITPQARQLASEPRHRREGR